MEKALVKSTSSPARPRNTASAPDRTAGEGVFVPVSDDAGEDDGYVLTYVYDAGSDSSDL